MTRIPTKQSDPGLQEIADLERDLLLSFEQRHRFFGTPAAAVAAERPTAAALARVVCGRLKDEYQARRNING